MNAASQRAVGADNIRVEKASIVPLDLSELNVTMTPNKRVFLAGATGVVGRVLCRLLVSDGWHVVGTTRKRHAMADLEALGVEAAVVDVFDEEALRAAVIRANPTAVIHQLTDLPKQLRPEDREEALARNARIREVGTKHLVDACAAAKVGHVIAQSIAFAYAPGAPPFSEEDPLDVNATDPVAARTARAVQTLESLVLNGPFRGVVLRYGRFYGPGTWASAPLPGTAVHVDAAADAARLALVHGDGGIYNVAEPGGTVSITKAVGQLGWSPSFRGNR
jgi:nucleoside-diphosphate-sugar epimerase